MTDVSESSPTRALADEYWEAVLRVNPTYATFLGDRRFDTEIEDVSVEAEAEQRARWAELLGRTRELAPDSIDERVTRDLLVESLADAIAHIDHRIVELRYDQMDGLVAGLLSAAPQVNAPQPQNALDLVERQHKVGDLVDGALARFRAGLDAGRTPPRIVVERALNQVDGYLASSLDDDPFTAFAALSHDPKIDDPGLAQALESGCFYVGALGSRRTHAARLDRLKAQGVPDAALQRIRAPIGLPIGASSPAEIAVSIMAEITAELRLPKEAKASVA